MCKPSTRASPKIGTSSPGHFRQRDRTSCSHNRQARNSPPLRKHSHTGATFTKSSPAAGQESRRSPKSGSGSVRTEAARQRNKPVRLARAMTTLLRQTKRRRLDRRPLHRSMGLRAIFPGDAGCDLKDETFPCGVFVRTRHPGRCAQRLSPRCLRLSVANIDAAGHVPRGVLPCTEEAICRRG